MKNTVLQFEVPPIKKAITLRQFLLQYRHGLNAQKLASLFHKKAICLNGEIASEEMPVKRGDLIRIEMPYSSSGIVAEEIPLEIIHEQDDFIVVNKPPGMACHPGLGIYKGTLLHALKYHFRDQEGILENGLIHRLDKDTSGLILVAKTQNAFEELSALFKNKKPFRLYHAVVNGRVEAEEFTVNVPVGRDENDPFLIRCFKDEEGGKPAVTHFRVLERKENKTLLECVPETGRTHQIRLHLQHSGYPILGDKRYGNKQDNVGRMYLHAVILAFEWREKYRFEKEISWDF